MSKAKIKWFKYRLMLIKDLVNADNPKEVLNIEIDKLKDILDALIEIEETKEQIYEN